MENELNVMLLFHSLSLCFITRDVGQVLSLPNRRFIITVACACILIFSGLMSLFFRQVRI